MCSWISVCVLGSQRHGETVEVVRCCVSHFRPFVFLPLRISKIAAERARINHISVFPIITVPKLTRVLSCRGYHLPNLIRERNTGKVHSIALLTLPPLAFLRQEFPSTRGP